MKIKRTDQVRITDEPVRPILKTKRLLFRQFTLDDVDRLHQIYSQPEMMRYIGDGSVPTYEQTKDWVQRQMDTYDQNQRDLWATVEKKSGSFIGRCGLISWEIESVKELEVGYLIDRNYWGEGFGTEAAQGIRDFAFQTYDISQLISLVQYSNQASRRVAEKNGMHLWKIIPFHGVSNVCVYRIQRKEWEKIIRL